MVTVNINDKVYDADQLSDEAKLQIASLAFVDGEIGRLQAHLAALQTARNAYSADLQKSIASVKPKA